MSSKPSFPGRLDPPLEYAQMYVDVRKWVDESDDEDERQRFSELANYYLACATESQARERARIRSQMSASLAEALEQDRRVPLPDTLTVEEAELVRCFFAVPGLAIAESLAFAEMHDLADMVEGWAQDPSGSGFDLARLLGMADCFRSVAEAVGRGWRPPPTDKRDLLAFLAQSMRTG